MAGMNPAEVIQQTCNALLQDKINDARDILRLNYEFVSQHARLRRYSELQKTRIFARDGFIDRYSGKHLVFIGILRVLSALLPDGFPYHPNWKLENCHRGYYELAPTLDHLVPITRGGKDEEQNWVTTSMLHNAVKGNWTLEELGWSLLPPGKLSEWDGLLQTFIEMVEAKQSLMEQKYFKAQYRLAKVILAALG